MRGLAALTGTIFTGAMLLAGTAQAAVIDMADFSDVSNMTLNGHAAQAVDGSARDVLRLTPSAGGRSGSAFNTSTVSLASDASFSTKFAFNINTPGGSSDVDGQGADGIVFVVQTVGNNVGGAGGGIGYQGISNSVGVEFDTWNNGGGDNNSGNHVGINLNGSMSSSALTAVPGRMNDGVDRFVWVDYDGVNDLLEVRLNTVDLRPGSAMLSFNVDLTGVLGQTDAYVGFTSGTGAAYNNHDILSWELRSTFSPIDEEPDTDIPAPAPLGAVLLGLLGLAATRRR